MTDQAALLREIAQTGRAVQSMPSPETCQIIAVTSGKGGVGKTNVVINLAIALKRAGKRVAVLDADFGLANVDVLLGLAPKYNLGHVIAGVLPLKSILVEGPEGIHIIPASSGIQELTELSDARRNQVLEQLNLLMDEYDIVLIDTAAGISNNVLRLLLFSRQVIVVSAPEPTAIVDAYALIKVLFKRHQEKEVFLLVNSVRNRSEAEDVFQQLARVIRQFLGGSIRLLGFILRDDKVQLSVRQQVPLLVGFPKTPVSRCFNQIASTLLSTPVGEAEKSWLHETSN